MALPHSDQVTANRILLTLSRPALDRLQPDFEAVTLERGHVIYQVDALITPVYFVDRGLVSLVKTMQDGRTVEIGAVGY